MRDLLERLEPDHRTAVEALRHHASTTPDKLALSYGQTGEEVTYAELDDRTTRLAVGLVGLDVEPGQPISLLTRGALASVYAMYGIWKAGAVYAPINFQYTDDLLVYQINDTKPVVLIVDPAGLAVVETVKSRIESMPRLVVIGGDGDGDGETSFESLLNGEAGALPEVAPDQPANIIYTSGTTGPSKGVVQSHRWVTAYTWVPRLMITPDDVVYNDLPLYHVGGAHYNVARALWVGATASLWDRFSPTDFWRRVKDHGCTTAILLDVMIPWLLKAEPSDDDRRNPLNKVYMQPLPATHHEFAERFGVDYVSAGFGQSETGFPLSIVIEETAEGEGTPADLYGGYTHEELNRLVDEAGLLRVTGETPLPKGVMGHEGPFVEVKILDEDDVECRPGEPGQLAIRPRVPSVTFLEYLAKPEATVKAWRNLWFHTGDAALRTDDGMFVFLDRIGDRIRVRGENISSFHIEELLLKHETVNGAAVIAVPGSEGDEDDVIAFVTPVEGGQVDADQLHRYCEGAMPKFMRPRQIVVVDEIPRTPTNKVEKYKLRKFLTEGRRA